MIPTIAAITAIVVITLIAMAAVIRLKPLAMTVFVLAMTLPYIVTGTIVGHPKPHWLEWGSTKYVLHSALLIEGKVIYLWLIPEGGLEPVSLSLPWVDSEASALVEAMTNSEQMGSKVIVQEGTVDGTFEYLPAPVLALPPKDQ